MKLVSREDLDELPIGLYVVGVDDRPECRWRDEEYFMEGDAFVKDVPVILLGRVRAPGKRIPKICENFHTRADGLEVLMAWAPLQPMTSPVGIKDLAR